MAARTALPPQRQRLRKRPGPPGHGTERDELLGVWGSQPHWNLTYVSPDKGPLFDQGNQQRVFSTVSMDLSASSPNAAPFTEGGGVYNSSVRYDYAGKIAGKFQGTVFTGARVELVMSQADPAVNESALHIYDALNRPERTFPSWPGKSVPGTKEPYTGTSTQPRSTKIAISRSMNAKRFGGLRRKRPAVR
ncbi:hypothetical protein [Streptomyces rishiriensis]|uniref:hypothetical protein n=1 Tax=Streptomyces rishiriensis TaxID=68264 RepID=UPI0037D53C76